VDVWNKIGTCIKNTKGFILERNSIAIATCGQFCDQFCIKNQNLIDNSCTDNKHSGFQCLHKIKTKEKKIADIVVAVIQDKIVTMVYPLDEQIENEFKMYSSKYDLTTSEEKIVFGMLNGLTNQQIADQLFISRSTLKKHLNNIYKKIPAESRPRHVNS
jgi:DNA-binding CsgD family transcriptional regulator